VVATLDRPRVTDPVTVAVIADAHLATDHRGTWKTLHRTEARLRTALEVSARGSDAVVFAGDQTHDGHPPELERFRSLAAGLNRPWVGLPGNHDVPKTFDDHDGPTLEDVCSRFTGDAATTDAAGVRYPLTLRVGELRIVCVNTVA
jgi:3',5'-cyclic AMP phosphodiesterase CpdA